jgi:hypothetical protein
MTGAQASVLHLVSARAPVVFKENILLCNRLELELQISDYRQEHMLIGRVSP